MNRPECDAVRDRLPEQVRGTLSADAAAALERHLRECAECRAEGEVLALLASALPAVPAGLEARVLAATQRPARRRWGSPAELAMAATLAAAVIGGALLIDGAGLREAAGPDPADTGSARAAVLPALVDPLLEGSLLPELTEAELQALLEEMES